MSATPPPHVPENKDLEELESETEDELLTPDEAALREVSDPHPTDAPASEKWDRPASDETLDD